MRGISSESKPVSHNSPLPVPESENKQLDGKSYVAPSGQSGSPDKALSDYSVTVAGVTVDHISAKSVGAKEKIKKVVEFVNAAYRDYGLDGGKDRITEEKLTGFVHRDENTILEMNREQKDGEHKELIACCVVSKGDRVKAHQTDQGFLDATQLYVGLMTVKMSESNKKLATQLMFEAEQFAKENHYKSLVVDVCADGQSVPDKKDFKHEKLKSNGYVEYSSYSPPDGGYHLTRYEKPLL
ncbi:hypothetical protein M3P05_03045 [Sansalvadorimonas sp. 2012CJ34-2]|uniref:N-acetyltransferase domain-containing protein n=1 Tax=Parendozoicomonas callyspongiae TaxID=2942213 RepID=A0ABT0PCA8_9GAMM|nr:hypothetical protein [Sansalvadorimonas sp. 2012CJ34-2]MCL6268928.1 hypothetical protein [Sansalvadorimonas sp. 2012CJ34-2]